MPTKAAQAPARRSFAMGEIDRDKRIVSLVASTAAPIRTWMETPAKDKNGDPIWDDVPLSIVSWDLSRAGNGVMPVLWAHDRDGIPIAKTLELAQTDAGLAARIQFATGIGRSDEIWRAVEQELVRGVSVGYGDGDDTWSGSEGSFTVVRKNAELLELSIVPVPADPGGIVSNGPAASLRKAAPSYDDCDEDDPEDCEAARAEAEAARRAALSQAGRALASGRRREARTDATDDEIVQRFDVQRTLGKFERTQVGGLRIPARLARIGVLSYRNADGTERRELRLPEEVFRKDSLETLRSAPVTDLAHHTGLIGTHNWKDAALGHVESVRTDSDRFIAGDVLIQDARAIVDLENGRLADVSAGYACRLEWKPGSWNGERYDAIQRDIKYNHVAVLPPGRGRSGTDVGLRLDAKDAFSIEEESTMAEPAIKTLIKLDGKDVEYGSKEHIAHLDAAHLADLARFDAKEKELTGKVDGLQARLDAAESDKKRLETELAAAKDPKAIQMRVDSRVALLGVARDALGTEFKSDGKSEREIMIDVIRTDANWKEFDGKAEGKSSDDYVRALYESIAGRVKRTDGVDSVVRAHREATRTDATETDPAEKARQDMIKRRLEASTKPITN